jgi:hypothetical protein
LKPLTPEEKKEPKAKFRRFILSRKRGSSPGSRRRLFKYLWRLRKGAGQRFGGQRGGGFFGFRPQFGGPEFGVPPGAFRPFTAFGWRPFGWRWHKFGGPFGGFGRRWRRFGPPCGGYGIPPFPGFGFGLPPPPFGYPQGFGGPPPPFGGFGNPYGLGAGFPYSGLWGGKPSCRGRRKAETPGFSEKRPE